MEVMAFMRELHEKGKLSKHIGVSFITLIAKKKGAEFIRNFRPISLIGFIYTVLVKVLASRQQKVLPGLISPAQDAFVHRQQILDGVLIAIECIHARHKDRRPDLICKLKKAYDRVDWDFLWYQMKMMGFGVKWRAWILESV